MKEIITIVAGYILFGIIGVGIILFVFGAFPAFVFWCAKNLGYLVAIAIIVILLLVLYTLIKPNNY